MCYSWLQVSRQFRQCAHPAPEEESLVVSITASAVGTMRVKGTRTAARTSSACTPCGNCSMRRLWPHSALLSIVATEGVLPARHLSEAGSDQVGS